MLATCGPRRPRAPRQTPTGVIMFVRSAGPGLTLSIGLGLLTLAGVAAPATAQTLLNQVHTIAAATTAVPVEETFDVTAAGTYAVTLTDLGATLNPPAPLAAVKMAVTNSSGSLVGTVLVGAGTLTLSSLVAGSYQLHIVGMPGNTPGSGPIGIAVNGPGMTQVAAFQDTLTLPSQALPDGEGVLDSSFSVSSSGNYTVTLTDMLLPQALPTLTLLLVPQGGAPLATLPVAGTGAMQTTVALSAGVTYDIFAVGAAGAPANAGLYGAVVTDSGGKVIFGRAVAVGGTIHLGSAALAAGSAALTLTDLKYPAALTQLAAVATLSGQAAASLSTGGQQSFTAASNTYEVFAYAGAAAAPGAGSYAVQVTQGGLTPLGVARAVVAPGSAESVYAFDGTIPSAGSYTVTLADFQFPAALGSLSIGVAQAGAMLGTLSSPGGSNVSAAAGPISVFVFAQAPAAGGLFGIGLAPATGGTPVLETTQAVGTLFSSQQIAISSSGTYAVTATDLGFPASFASYDTIVTQGTTAVGSIFGGGTFNFAATPGSYFINFIAQPTGADLAGTYALTLAVAPPAPTVSLSVDHPQVASGNSVDLIWSSTNATSCTASGGWSGNEPTSGTATSSPLTVSTTFTLTCTGPGGNSAQSVTVTVTAASGGGGGGGAADPALLAALGAALAAACRRRFGARATR